MLELFGAAGVVDLSCWQLGFASRESSNAREEQELVSEVKSIFGNGN